MENLLLESIFTVPFSLRHTFRVIVANRYRAVELLVGYQSLTLAKYEQLQPLKFFATPTNADNALIAVSDQT